MKLIAVRSKLLIKTSTFVHHGGIGISYDNLIMKLHNNDPNINIDFKHVPLYDIRRILADNLKYFKLKKA